MSKKQQVHVAVDFSALLSFQHGCDLLEDLFNVAEINEHFLNTCQQLWIWIAILFDDENEVSVLCMVLLYCC